MTEDDEEAVAEARRLQFEIDQLQAALDELLAPIAKAMIERNDVEGMVSLARQLPKAVQRTEIPTHLAGIISLY